VIVTGKVLREMRMEAGLSQARLARLAKVSQAHIAKIESEKVDPRLSTVNRILRILKTSDRRKRCRSVMNQNIISVEPGSPIEDTVRIMRQHDISQLPVMDGHVQVGSVDEATIIRNMDRRLKTLQVRHIMDRPFPVVDVKDPVELAQPLLDFHSAVLVADRGRLKGIITKVDLLGMR
jgi:predicted transcriptional regulator